MLEIYNSLTRRKEKFIPRIKGKVGMYVCGMTVYDYCHLGHARVLVVFDMVARYLRYLGFEVTYVRNITDIDDKIIKRAAENGEQVDELTARFIDAMHEDEDLLGVLRPDVEPRATEYVEQITELVKQLVQNDLAYQGDNGDVYYHVRRFPAYGQLSGQSVDDLRVGARIAPDESKLDPLDFVLWKTAKPGEPQWQSPWGMGRPGWHIECSAMSTQCLGENFDIHGGGMDLKFPHHESEIAQSEGVTGKKFVNLWMHNGYVEVDREKMSKSLGNFFTIREILAMDDNQARMGEVIRYMVLASHYRRPLHYSDQALTNARAALTRMYLTLDKLEDIELVEETTPDTPHREQFKAALNDDFNTPEALAVVFDLVREINKAIDQPDFAFAFGLRNLLMELTEVLGLLRFPVKEFLASQSDKSAISDEDVERMIEQRLEARRNKDWKSADDLRDRLIESGIVLEDRSVGRTHWRRS